MQPKGAPQRPKKVRRSNRETVQYVPVTEASFARAVMAAEDSELDLAIWLDEAIKLHLVRTEADRMERLYQEACAQAADDLMPEPTRREFALHQSFVRRPAGESDYQAGRPSSRHHPEAWERKPGQRREAGPEPRAATRSPS